MECEWTCACCGQPNTTVVDESAGSDQEYTEDCRVCCRPNLLTIAFNPYLHSFQVTAGLEGRD